MAGWDQGMGTGDGVPPRPPDPARSSPSRTSRWHDPRVLAAVSVAAVLLGITGLVVAAPTALDKRWWRERAEASGGPTATRSAPGTGSDPAGGGSGGGRSNGGSGGTRPAAEPPARGPALFAGSWGEPRFIGDHLVIVGDGVVQSYRDDPDPVLEWTYDACEYPEWVTFFVEPDVDAVVLRCESDYVALDPADGTVRWTRAETDEPDRIRVGGSSLVTQTDAHIVAIDLATGQDRWVDATYGSANVTVDGTRVYVSNDVGVHALDAATGVSTWTNPIPSSDVFVGRDAVYARSSDHTVAKLDPGTGTVLWRTSYEQDRLDWSAFMGETEHTVVLFTHEHLDQITAYDKTSGARVWIRDIPDERVSVAVGADLVAIEHGDGNDTPFTELLRDRSGAPVATYEELRSSVAVGDEHLAYLTDDGSYDPVVMIVDVP